MAKTSANCLIASELAVRSLLFLLLLDGALALSKADVNGFLDKVNEIRSIAFHPASDMRYMAWSEQLEAEAHEIVKMCILHDTVLNINSRALFVPHWIKKNIHFYGSSLNEFYQGEREWTVRLSHMSLWYLSMAEAGADRIGCSIANCTIDPYYTVCITNARRRSEANASKILPYTRGPPCQRCPPSAGYCYKNLCVSHATKTDILSETPSAVITCDAPCLNCGERKEVNNTCVCQCPKGTSDVDCSKGSSNRSCPACRRAPCQNGGREIGPCRCQCTDGYVGKFCETPMLQIVGGVVVRLRYNGSDFFPRRDGDRLAEIFKGKMADGINSFCSSNQINYIKCCGTGTLPSSGPTDFVDASMVHVTSPFVAAKSSYSRATVTIYATAKGNNGLCRKRTSIPPPIVAVPPEVITEVIQNHISGKLLCCDVYVEEAMKSFAEYYNVSMPMMNYISIKVG